MQLLIRMALLVALVLLGGKVLNRLFPNKSGEAPREDEAPIIDGTFTDIEDDTDGSDGKA
ncbi:MAG: hypothetical protein K6B40_02665 [Firmicutes bacterium]|nr:hypothetical protein [Bacillota bacterium]